MADSDPHTTGQQAADNRELNDWRIPMSVVYLVLALANLPSLASTPGAARLGLVLLPVLAAGCCWAWSRRGLGSRIRLAVLAALQLILTATGTLEALSESVLNPFDALVPLATASISLCVFIIVAASAMGLRFHGTLEGRPD
jgi:hypothetical protein